MFEPLTPTIRVEPREIAKDTWIVHSPQQATGAPLLVHLNSMVILGEEPVIVDTNTPANREQWLTDVFDLVEPDDVRWVFVSNDDSDHAGNLDVIMERCPKATLVGSQRGRGEVAVRRRLRDLRRPDARPRPQHAGALRPARVGRQAQPEWPTRAVEPRRPLPRPTHRAWRHSVEHVARRDIP